MRILEVVHDNRYGGIAARSLRVATRLKNQGVETVFLLPREEGEVADLCRERHFEVHQIPLRRPHPQRLVQTLIWLLSFPLSVAILARIALKRRIDVVHVNGFIGLQAVTAALLVRKPLLWHLCGTASYPHWFVKLLRPVMRRTSVVSISRAVRDYFLGSAPATDREFILREPVDWDELRKRQLRENHDVFRTKRGIPRAATVVCTVANLSPIKGIEYLIEAAAALRARYPDLYYAVIGKSLETQKAYEKRLREAIGECRLTDRFFLIGGRTDVPEILQECNIFVLPSVSEGTPISILEAMSYRLPVVATEVGGIAEQLRNGDCGILIPPKDSQAIADAIAKLLNSSKLRNRLGDNGYEHVRAEYTLDSHVREFQRILDRVNRHCRAVGTCTSENHQ